MSVPTWLATWTRERNAGTPLVALATPDVPASAREIATASAGKWECVLWTCSGGLAPGNTEGEAAISKMTALLGDCAPEAVTNLGDCLVGAKGLPSGGVLVIVLAHMHWTTPIVRCAISGLRDAYKGDGRMLVLLAPDVADLPREIVTDVRVLRDALPDRAQRAMIITETYASADSLPDLPDERVQTAVDATAGLTAFAVEQATATAVSKKGLDLDTLRVTSRESVNARKGLRISDERVTYGDVGGLGALAGYVRSLFLGPDRPAAVVLLDEIEKMLAGSGGGDLSGVSSDILGALLTWIERRKVHGILLMGPPGSGKSLSAQAAAGEHGVPLVWMDVGAMKGSLVGESGANLRAALDTIDAVSEGRCLLVATCNGVQELRPELLRRFKPRFMVDLPDEATHADIWKIQLAAHGLTHGLTKKTECPDSTGWTGAEIRDACKIARATGTTPREAARYIVPISVSSAQTIARVRQEATGKFIDANEGGPYKGPSSAPAPVTGRATRKIRGPE